MSAETLRSAAAQMKADAETCGDASGTLIPATADWLEEVAAWSSEGLGVIDARTNWPDMWDGMLRNARRVARAYLGEVAE